jgi:hypothetical protein
MSQRIRVALRDFDWPSEQLGELRASNELLGDRVALQARMAEDGYLLLRDFLDRETVLAGRRRLLEFLQPAILPGTDLMDGIIAPGLQAGLPRDTGKDPKIRAVLENPRLFEFFATYFAEPALTFDNKWMRAVGHGGFTGAHYDVVYMGRGSQQLHTVWTPFGDIAAQQGTLAVCVGSHNLPSFERLRQTYGKVDVDRDNIAGGGWFTRDPAEIQQKFGGVWRTADFRAGDVIIFTMFTLHCSTANLTNRWRLTSDTRFQPASEPADERWVGGNYPGHNSYGKNHPGETLEAAKARWGL